jgi:hypothetical protein
MNYKDIIGRLMMLASRMEAEGKEQDRQACAEAAGVIMSLSEVRVLPHSTLMSHPSLQEAKQAVMYDFITAYEEANGDN